MHDCGDHSLLFLGQLGSRIKHGALNLHAEAFRELQVPSKLFLGIFEALFALLLQLALLADEVRPVVHQAMVLASSSALDCQTVLLPQRFLRLRTPVLSRLSFGKTDFIASLLRHSRIRLVESTHCAGVFVVGLI